MRAGKWIIFLLLSGCYSVFYGQTGYQTRDSTYIFWQQGTRIIYEDYKGPSFPNAIPVVAEIAIWTALDVPEAPEVKQNKAALFYMAPVFDRRASHAGSNDSILIAIDNIYFDIAEVCARAARKQMTGMYDTLGTSADISNAFRSVVKAMHEKRLRMYRKFYREFYRNKNAAALNTWRKELGEELKQTARWATRPRDCHRFISKAPLEKGYQEDLSCNPRLLSDNYEQVLAPDTWHAGFNQVSRFGMK